MLWGPVILLSLYAVLGCLAKGLYTIFKQKRHYLRWFTGSLIPLIVFFFSLVQAPASTNLNALPEADQNTSTSIPSVNVDSFLQEPVITVKHEIKTHIPPNSIPPKTKNETGSITDTMVTNPIPENNPGSAQGTALDNQKPETAVPTVQAVQPIPQPQPEPQSLQSHQEPNNGGA